MIYFNYLALLFNWPDLLVFWGLPVPTDQHRPSSILKLLFGSRPCQNDIVSHYKEIALECARQWRTTGGRGRPQTLTPTPTPHPCPTSSCVQWKQSWQICQKRKLPQRHELQFEWVVAGRWCCSSSRSCGTFICPSVCPPERQEVVLSVISVVLSDCNWDTVFAVSFFKHRWGSLSPRLANGARVDASLFT